MNAAAFDRMRSDQDQAARVMHENIIIVTEQMITEYEANIKKINLDPGRNKNTAEILVNIIFYQK